MTPPLMLRQSTRTGTASSALCCSRCMAMRQRTPRWGGGALTTWRPRPSTTTTLWQGPPLLPQRRQQQQWGIQQVGKGGKGNSGRGVSHRWGANLTRATTRGGGGSGNGGRKRHLDNAHELDFFLWQISHNNVLSDVNKSYCNLLVMSMKKSILVMLTN